MCCLQEVRWRGQGSRMLGLEERRYRLWWCGKRYAVDEVMLKEELCVKVMKVGCVCDSRCVVF